MERIRNIERFARCVIGGCIPVFWTNNRSGVSKMLIRKVEQFLRTHDMAATKFGRLAAHDPRFVLDLRMGRIPRAKVEQRTLAWMAEFEQHTRTLTNARPALRCDLPRDLETKGFAHAA